MKMTNRQAMELIGKPITVRHRITGDTYNVVLTERWKGTIFYVAENVFGIEQTTSRPLFNIYPVELCETYATMGLMEVL
jgi:hypothetical protein